ncbi:MAG: hypothetical protein ACI3XA_07940 [Clostridia bacterium]
MPAGEYTITVEVNPERSFTEAYYYNNFGTYDFTVSDKSYDLTEVSFKAQIGEYVNGVAEAELTLDGYDTIDIPPDVQSWLLVSYYDNGKWSAWSIADKPGNNAVGSMSLMGVSMPDSCLIYARGQKARLRLAIEPADTKEPLLNIYSNEIDLRYVKIGISADETNTGVYTALDRAACCLAEGELIAFKLTNLSTYDCGEITSNAVVYAANGNEKFELFRQNGISLPYGAEPETIGFAKWSADNLSGTYEIIAVAESEYGGGEVVLGSLYVKEQMSLTVTTGEDITNEYDGIISLSEAVSYANELGGGEITFAEGVDIIYRKSPITIDSDIKIKGHYSEYINTYTTIYGLNATQIFNVTENGSLEGEKLNLNAGYSKNYGGAVENNGGSVSLNNCVILYSKSGISGGGIYSKGGSVKLSNCAFKGNESGYGGAIGIDYNAKLDMINCSVFLNTSNSGAIYNNGGEAVIINSTFTDNTASSSGGGAITSPCGKVSLLGSIAVLNGETDIDGAVTVYGSYITAASEKAELDSLTQKGDGIRLFACRADGSVIWNTFSDGTLMSYKAYASDVIDNGIYLKNSDGKIAYSVDNSQWIITGIPSAFTDDEYKTDILGEERGRCIGSIAQVCGDAIIIDAIGGKAYIYAPREDKMVLIEKSETYDNTMTDISLYRADVEPGTNVIELKDTAANGDVKTYMLWDGVDNMRPMANAFVGY